MSILTCSVTAPPRDDGQSEGRTFLFLFLSLQLPLLAASTLVSGPRRRALLAQEGVSHGTFSRHTLRNYWWKEKVGGKEDSKEEEQAITCSTRLREDKLAYEMYINIMQ